MDNFSVINVTFYVYKGNTILLTNILHRKNVFNVVRFPKPTSSKEHASRKSGKLKNYEETEAK